MEDLKIIKIGGNVIDDHRQLDSFLEKFYLLQGPKLLVHGGGKKASEVSNQLGVIPKKIEGRRITDHQTLDIVTMVYAGLINKTIVAKLQQIGCNALGLSGADGNVIQGSKRPVKSIDYGFAGDIESNGVNRELLKVLLDEDVCPVLCAITHDKKGQLLNTNADTIATTVAMAMAQDYNSQLIYCFEKQGVLTDPKDDDSWLEELNYENFQTFLKQNVITEGMIPKLTNAFEALKAGVDNVQIKSAENIIQNSGTQIILK